MGNKKTAQTISAKKTLKKVIALQLVKELTDITGKLSLESKKLTKVIEKGAKKLAKKISKEIKPIINDAPQADKIETAKPAPLSITPKPAIKNPAPKTAPAKSSQAKTTIPK